MNLTTKMRYFYSTLARILRLFSGYPLTITNAVAGDLNEYTVSGNSKQSILPDGYTQLEYIQSEGTSSILPYIDTLFVPTINSKARVKFCPVTTNRTGFFGSRSDGTSARFCGTTFSVGTYFAFSMNNNSWSTNRTDVTIGNVYDCTAYNGKQIINGTEYTEPTITEFNTTSTFKLAPVTATGDAGGAGTTEESFNIKYYLCQLWENDILVHDFIPAKHNSDNVLGMYDLITNTFFTNAGTGSFTAGPVAPTPSAPIEVTSVGDRTINLFDMKYDVGYTGSYPNITTVSGGKSTEWIETSKFGQYFYFIWNVKELLANCVLGLVYSNDKSEILYRDGLVNSSIVPAVNTDYVGGGGNPYKINSTYTYVKFYFLNWANVNRIGIYTTLQNTFIPYGYKIPVINGANCGVVDLGTLTWTYRSDLAAGVFTTPFTTYNKQEGNTNLFLAGYTTINSSGTGLNNLEVCGHNSTPRIYVCNTDYTDVASFKTAMSGKYLYYQRTTDASWTIPTTTNIYLSEPIRKVGTYADSVFYGEGKNLFDNTTNNKWIAVSGEITEATGCCARKFICNAGDVFVLKAKYSTTTANNIICVCAYDANGNKLTRTVKTDFVEDSIRFICPSSTAYIYAGRSTDVPSDIMLIKGYTVPTEYQPFSDTSKITRNVGVKVLDGTESWSWTGSYKLFYFMPSPSMVSSPTVMYATHFTKINYSQAQGGADGVGYIYYNNIFISMHQYDNDLAGFKSWLAAQYAAGTPVIVYYQLATPTTEVNATPAITVAKGMNILTTGTELVPSNMTAKAWTE